MGSGRRRTFDYGEAARLVAHGHSVRDVAERFGVTIPAIYRAVRFAGVPAPSVEADRRRTEREEYVAATIRAGHTLEEIGQTLGLSRERVRQIAVRAGVAERSHGKGDDPVRVLRAARGARGVTEACRLAGVGHATMHRVLNALGKRVACERLWAWRRRSAARTALIAALHRMAAQEGREPVSTDFITHRDGYPSHTSFFRHFGSFNNALAAAGFSRHGLGSAGHQRPIPVKTHCVRGHEFREGSYWLYRRPVGRGFRTCKECHRIRKQTYEQKKKSHSLPSEEAA